MPRRARLSLAGIPWHIIQRGNNRSPCFYSRDDFHYYLEKLGELAAEHDCEVHAYVLMTNHVHLLLTPKRVDSASLMMKHLGQRYVQYINRTYRRSGTLWEGRFRSCLTQNTNYVLACYRYIELNPVRAKMVSEPAAYPWSSYAANALGEDNALITPHFLYSELARDNEARCAAYRQLVQTRLEQTTITDIRKSTNGNFVVGDKRFKDEIASILKRRVVPGQPGRPKAG